MHNSKKLAIVAIVLAMASIQYGASLAKHLFPVLGPLTTTMLRTGLAAIAMALILRPWRESLPRGAWRAAIPYGLCLGAMNLLFYLALERIPLGLAVALEFTGPLGLALVKSRRKIHLLWVLLAACGIYLILPLGARQGTLDSLGIGMAVAAGLFWAGYIVYGQRVGNILPSRLASCLGMIVAASLALPAGLSGPIGTLTNSSLWVTAGLVALLSSALPYTLEMYALKRLPVQTFGILMSIEPAIATLMGLLFLRENLSAMQWMAIFAIMLASAGSTLSADPGPARTELELLHDT